MSRPLRLEYPGALWHVMSRGVERRDIFLGDRDRRTFLALLAKVVPRFRWRLHAFVLMTNHYHLLVETVEPTLSRGMQQLGGRYAEIFNLRQRRVGPLFQGRFKAHLIDSEPYLLEVARYVVLNPVRAKMVSSPADWQWSSYGATAGLTAAPPWLTTDTVLGYFDRADRVGAARLYHQFVSEPIERISCPWDRLVGQLYLGGEQFIDSVQQRIDESHRSSEHPREQRIVRCASLEEVERALRTVAGTGLTKSSPNRVRIAYAELARSEALATLPQIGKTLSVGPTGVSYLIRRARQLRSDPNFRQLLERVRITIRNCRLQM